MLSLITGANGFIGSHITRFLLKQGERVRVLVRSQSNLRSLAGLPVEFVRADLRNPDSLPAALRNVDCVYHVAADYRLWAANPREIYESNVDGTRNLLARGTAGQDCAVCLHQQRGHPGSSPAEETAGRADFFAAGRYDRPLQALETPGRE